MPRPKKVEEKLEPAFDVTILPVGIALVEFADVAILKDKINEIIAHINK